MTLVFLDTETTSLRHDRRAWEIAAIVRREGQPDHEQSWFINYEDLDLGNADLTSLNIGRFYDRHPDVVKVRDGRTHEEIAALTAVEMLTRGAIIVGAVPWFDTDVLGQRMRANGICPSWHYHLQCVTTLALGYLAGQGKEGPSLPLKSDDLSRLIGIEPPGPDQRHTALGDARWCRDIWDRVMGTGVTG